MWFTSDTHFRHKFVAGLRGFASAEEHDEALIRRWNAVVQPKAQVWHLGDVALRDIDDVLENCIGRLNGEIHLVTGNHDDVWPGHRKSHTVQRKWLKYFASVQAYARKRIAGRDVLLCHFPYPGQDRTEEARYAEYRLHDTGLPLIHGHVHDAWQFRGHQINVGVDRWNLQPVSVREIEKWLGGLT